MILAAWLAMAFLASQAGRPVPALVMNAKQRDVIRAAAEPYRGTMVSIVERNPTPSSRRFAQAFEAALKAAGLDVSVREESVTERECPSAPGLGVIYGPARSGAVNAIAEALIRSRVLSDSVGGCRVTRDDELTFIVSSATS